jgi:hypothetical protein
VLPGESVISTFSPSLKGASSADGFHQASKSFFDFRTQVYDLLQYSDWLGNQWPGPELTGVSAHMGFA